VAFIHSSFILQTEFEYAIIKNVRLATF